MGIWCSPDLVPCDIFLFPNLKVIKGTRFPNEEPIKKAVTTEQRNIPGEAFQQSIAAWQRRMGKCAELRGMISKVITRNFLQLFKI